MDISSDSITRFWQKVQKTDSCWNWTASKDKYGYGMWNYRTSKKQQFMRAHRFAFLLSHGQLTPGKEINHICKNTSCVNSKHLEELTREEHMRKTPGTYGYKWGHRSKCEKGHPLKGKNLMPFALKRGFRKCRECSIEASKKWRTENPEKMKAAVKNWRDNNLDTKRAYDRWYNEHVRGHKPRNPKPAKA